MADWQLVSVERITTARRNRLADMYMLSPYVWAEGERFRLLVRAVPRRDDEPRLKMAEIWHGTSDDGLHFDMDIAPTIFPGPDLVDLDGCEDPTVRMDGNTLRVWYTGYNEQQKTGRLLLARGPDVYRLAKAGVALESTPDFTNPKEGTIVAASDGWRLFFEYAHEGASLIGQALAAELDGSWSVVSPAPITPRESGWDGWHLSPGPVIDEDSDAPVMFYNGATKDAAWRIGWVRFSRGFDKVIGRCEEPLVPPDGDVSEGAADIAFAASAVTRGDEVLLYFSQSDQDLRRATLRRC